MQFFWDASTLPCDMKPLHPAWKKNRKIVIGMLHLPPLPGSPMFDGNLRRIRESLLRDADILARGGVHGLMMENFGDVPSIPSACRPMSSPT